VFGGVPSKSFIKANRLSKQAEGLLAEIIESWGVRVLKPPIQSYYPDYDLKLDTGRTIEVKHDRKAHLTGNLYLELDAINHSKADVLAIAYGVPIKCFYLTELDKVKQLVNTWGAYMTGGEFNQPAVLIKRTLFLELIKPEILELTKRFAYSYPCLTHQPK
jgi:hypothetical protein